MEKSENEVLKKIISQKIFNLFKDSKTKNDGVELKIENLEDSPEELFILSYSGLKEAYLISEILEKIKSSWSVKVTLVKSEATIEIEINQYSYKASYEEYLSEPNTMIEKWLEYIKEQ